MNDEIDAPEVRILDVDGSHLGVMPPARALALAKDQRLDLVEVVARSQPPVCKIMDYDRYRQTH